MKCLIIIPAFNEEENIERVVENLREHYAAYDYVVVNDGSSDNTAAICKKRGYSLIDLPVNLGLAGAFQTGLKYAYRKGYDCALQFDADGQHRPEFIASMIEKETDSEDYRTISSVIYNRLTNLQAETAGYLQIDATLVYLNGGKVPTEADKAIASPYNTYLYQGLPAGPISNPGMASLLAAMEPESTNYYFYVLNPETKEHEFSRTYAEHSVLVQRYQGNGG